MSSSTRKAWNKSTSENMMRDAAAAGNGSNVVLFEAARFRRSLKTGRANQSALSWHLEHPIAVGSVGEAIPVEVPETGKADRHLPRTKIRSRKAAPDATFCQIVALPRGAQPQNIRASFKDGVLEITILV